MTTCHLAFHSKASVMVWGFWERLIGLTKQAVKKTLGRAFVSQQKLETIITEIEAMLNDKSLTYVFSDISDPEPLTPTHLIYGRIQSDLHTLDDLDELNDPTYLSNVDIRRVVDKNSQLIQRFGSRWRKAYLTALREFYKINGANKQSIKKGDIVGVHDDTPSLN